MATKAFVLAGGEGRRLAPLTTIIPKPLVPVGNQSILEILLLQIVAAGILEITVSIGYLGNLIEAVIGDGSRLGARVTYTREPAPLGTAGALGLMEPIDDSDNVLVVNGDTLTNLDFGQLVLEHRRVSAAATVACHRRRIVSEFGVLEIDDQHGLVGYHEKPAIEQVVSMGVNVIAGRHVNQHLRPARHCNMPDLLVNLMGDHLVHCVEHNGIWLDLGRVDDVRAANELFIAQPNTFLTQ